MTKRITVPSTIEEATTQLEGLDSLLTAKEWERAATVFAFTRDGRSTDSSSGIYTVTQFAKLKIRGLASPTSVIHYRDNWKAAVAAGQAVEVAPGDKVALPKMKWPATRTGTDGYETPEGAAKTIEKIVQKHGAAVIPATTTVDALEQSDEAQQELTKRTAKRNARHKAAIDKASADLREVADKAAANYDEADTGTDVETAQTLVRITRLVHEAELLWAMKGGERHADIVSQLSELQSAVDDWRKRVTGSGSVEISEDDRAWADELGIDLGVSQQS